MGLATGFVTPIATVSAQTILIAAEINASNVLLADIAANTTAMATASGVSAATGGGSGIPLGALGGWASRGIANFKASKLGKAGIGVGLAGAAASVGGNMLAEGAEPGGFRSALGKSLGVVGNIAATAGTGATIGSMAGGHGALIGGGIGLVVGAIQQLGQLQEVTASLTQTEEAAKTSMYALTQAFDVMPEKMEKATKSAAEGFWQEQARLAQKIGGVTAAGGGSITSSIQAQMRGAEATRAQLAPTIQRRQVELAEARTMAENLPAGQDRQAKLEEIRRGEAQLAQLEMESLKAFDLTNYFDLFNKQTEAQTKTFEQEKTLAENRLNVIGLVNGTLDEINTVQAKTVASAQKEIAVAAARYRDLQIAQVNTQNSLRAELNLAGISGERRSALNAMLAANEKAFEIEKRNLLLTTQRAQLAQYTVNIEQMQRAVTGFREGGQFRTREAAGGTARARFELGGARGQTPENIARDLGVAASAQAELAAISRATLQRDLAAIADRRDKAIDAARLMKDASGETLAVTEAAVAAEKRRQETLHLETAAITAQTHAIQEEIARSRARINVQTETLTTQKDLAEFLGSSYSTIFNLQSQILDRQISAMELTRQEMSRIEAAAKAAGGSAADLPRYQELQVQLVKQQAEVTKLSLGRQRDFLDKALGRAFGVGSGSRIQPLINERAIFGERMMGPGGLNISGRPMTIGQREQAFGQVGAQRPLAPIGGNRLAAPPMGAPGQLEMMPGGRPFGAPGVNPRPAPVVQPQPVEVMGNINVTVSINPGIFNNDAFNVAVDRRINIRNKRGNP